MEFYKSLPIPSDRMGEIWALSSIENASIIEFGPAGTTHFAIEIFMQFNGEHKGKIFTTHIDESDISLGTYDRLEKAILEVDLNYNPKVIFVMASSISAIIGTDIPSICDQLQDKVKAKLIPLTSGGFRGDYPLGIENAIRILCEEIVEERTKKGNKYNIIGCTIDSYKFLADCEEIKSILKKGFGLEINSVFTAYSSIEELQEAGEASLNLVLRGEGLKGAKVLKEKYDIPYLYKKPYGLEGTLHWIRNIESITNTPVNEEFIMKNLSQIKKHLISYKMMTRNLKDRTVILVGDYDIVIGLADLMEELDLEVDKIIVKHSLLEEVEKFIPDKWKDKLLFNLSEREIEKTINSKTFYMLLADGGTLLLPNKAKLQFQISNPNLIEHNIYPYTPYVGFNGILYLIERFYALHKSAFLD